MQLKTDLPGANADAISELREISELSEPALAAAVIADLRTDHAGESGAVMIYRGILAVTRDPGVRRFAVAHLATEVGHLAAIEPLLTAAQRSVLLPAWRVAGWLTGALPALFGPRAVYATVAAVETFVDHHYAEQIQSIDKTLDLSIAQPLNQSNILPPAARQRAQLQSLRALLQTCRDDEIAHRDEAAALFALAGQPPCVALRIWVHLVDVGSRGAVKVCRHI